MLPERSTRRAAWLAALGLLTISLTGCSMVDGTSANSLQTFVDDFLRQLIQAAVL
jgi:hypothetical protein